MTNSISKPPQTTWWIAHDNDTAYHYGMVKSNQELITPKSVLEQFSSAFDLFTRMAELNITISESSFDIYRNNETIPIELKNSVVSS